MGAALLLHGDVKAVERPRLETLFLDAGGVLVFPNWTRVSEALRRRGVDVAPAALAAAEPRAKFEIDGEMRAAATSDTQRRFRYLDLILKYAGVRRSDATDEAVAELEAYHGAHNLWESVPADVEPALERLAALGLRLVVVSNSNGVLHACFDRVGLSRHFQCICDSFLEGVEKPDPRFFRIAMERSGADPATTMHVGDLYHVDIVGARNSGLRATLLDAADLYGDFDCTRVRSLDALVALIEKER
jgi:putative hydrolase of the HAD superfamily